MTSIYRDAMSRDFGAKVITDECGSKRLVALDASPLPSLDQYRYQVRKALGQDEIDRVRWGPTRHRRRNAQYRGKFSSAVSNVYERVEADAYYCERSEEHTSELQSLMRISYAVFCLKKKKKKQIQNKLAQR